MKLDLDAETKNVDRLLREARVKVKAAKNDVRRLEGAKELLTHLARQADEAEGESLPPLDTPALVGAGVNGSHGR